MLPAYANTVAGELTFQKDGSVTTTYQVGDTVTLQYVDTDRNADASSADTIDVLVTSDTEDTGTAASASDPVAGSGNSGDGTLTVSGLGVDTKTETWTLTAISQESFLVSGSVSGSQDSTLNVGESYTTDGGEVSFLVEQGSLGLVSTMRSRWIRQRVLLWVRPLRLTRQMLIRASSRRM